MTIRPEDMPDILTEWGVVDKHWQWQAGENARLDPVKKALLLEKLGEEEARRRYPNAWSDEESNAGKEGK